MARTIVIEGSAVYELDENCMLKKADKCKREKEQEKNGDKTNEIRKKE